MSENGWTWSYEKSIASDTEDSREVVASVLAELEKSSWPEHDVFGVHLAMEEALVNAIKHGNHRDPEKAVDVVCHVSPDRVFIRITDEGDGFDPESVPDPTEEDNLEIPSGRGLMLMRCYMDSVEFNARGNEVTMTKARSTGEELADEDEDEDDEDD
jgi:serine/threonine-protein kinase RsbW